MVSLPLVVALLSLVVALLSFLVGPGLISRVQAQ
jgi:hypothetical protein